MSELAASLVAVVVDVVVAAADFLLLADPKWNNTGVSKLPRQHRAQFNLSTASGW